MTTATLAGIGPVSRIAGIVITAAAVIGNKGIRNHIVARQNIGIQIRMWPVAGIQYRHDYALTRGSVPGCRGANTAGILIVMPLVGILGIVWCQGWL